MGQSTPFISYFSTPSKLFINQWTALHELLLRDPAHAHDNQSEPELMDDQTLINAFNGPLSGFFRMALDEYRHISQKRFASHIATDEGLHGIDGLNKKLHLSDREVTDVSAAKLDKHQRALNILLKDHYDAWIDFIHGARKTLLEALKDNSIPIAESEETEMYLKDNRAEIQSRLIDLKLESFSDTTVLTIADYLHLKATIAINNAFYRNQQPDEIAQMKQHLKRLKNTFTQLRNDEQQLLNQQKEAYQTLASEQA